MGLYLHVKAGYAQTQRKQLTLIFDRDEIIELIQRSSEPAEASEDDTEPGGLRQSHLQSAVSQTE